MNRILSYLLVLGLVVGAFFIGAYTGTINASAGERRRVELLGGEAMIEGMRAKIASDEISPASDDTISFSMEQTSGTNHFINPVYTDLNELIALVYEQAQAVVKRYANVESLEIALDSHNVNIIRGGDALLVKFDEWIADEYAVEYANGKLTIDAYSDKMPLYIDGNANLTAGWLGDYLEAEGKDYGQTIDIVIPHNMPLLDVKISTVNGSISMSGLNVDRIDVSSANGSITVRDAGINRKSYISTGNGVIDVQNCMVQDVLELSLRSGIIHIKNVTGNVDAGLGNGIINAADSSFGSNTMFSAGNGEINMDGCAFGKITISTVNGGGEIGLAGGIEDYDISFSTLSGALLYNGEAIENFRNRDAASKMIVLNESGTFAISGKP